MVATIPEGAVALAVGTLLALIALAFVLAPLVQDDDPQPKSPNDSRASRDDANAAVEAAIERARLRQPTCPACGPRPQADAAYCSNCGKHLV